MAEAKYARIANKENWPAVVLTSRWERSTTEVDLKTVQHRHLQRGHRGSPSAIGKKVCSSRPSTEMVGHKIIVQFPSADWIDEPPAFDIAALCNGAPPSFLDVGPSLYPEFLASHPTLIHKTQTYMNSHVHLFRQAVNGLHIRDTARLGAKNAASYTEVTAIPLRLRSPVQSECSWV